MHEKTAQFVIEGFFSRIVNALDNGDVNVVGKDSSSQPGKVLSYTVRFEGHEIISYEDAAMINGYRIEKDSWVEQPTRQLWNSCIERSIMQSSEEASTEQDRLEQQKASNRKQTYDHLASQLADAQAKREGERKSSDYGDRFGSDS